jgi:hypothetical protein
MESSTYILFGIIYILIIGFTLYRFITTKDRNFGIGLSVLFTMIFINALYIYYDNTTNQRIPTNNIYIELFMLSLFSISLLFCIFKFSFHTFYSWISFLITLLISLSGIYGIYEISTANF